MTINTISSQSTNINHIKCFNSQQLTEIYNGLKQGEVLKKRLRLTEETLNTKDKLVTYQRNQLNERDIELKELQKTHFDTVNYYKKKETEYTHSLNNLHHTIETNKKEYDREIKRVKKRSILSGGVAGAVFATLLIMIVK